MSNIKILAPSEIQKIAAGEVIERPANVVKELVENSIDAQASKISIFIESAGQRLIRVIDNGHGMDEADAELCFQHHATSKIDRFDDLARCATFGFRGEGLTSIAAISKVTLSTKQAASNSGITVQKTPGQPITMVPASVSTGCDISVQDLFFNVPARKKFLKKDQTEWRHIAALFQTYCFAYPRIHFSLYHDSMLVHNCPPVSNYKQRTEQLWETPLSQGLLEINHTHNHVHYRGLISNQHTYRYDRSQIIFFVNNRCIKNNNLFKALMKGYLNVLPTGRFPAAIIAITIDPAAIDINIHPRKDEILFEDGRVIEQQLTKLVTDGLAQHITGIITSAERYQTNPTPPSMSGMPALSLQMQRPQLRPMVVTNNVPVQERISEHFSQPVFQDFQYLGTYRNTYLLCQHGPDLTVIDQHAAHERVLYEQFKKFFSKTQTVELLFAHKVSINTSHLLQLKNHLALIESHGIKLDILDTDLYIRAIPVYLKESDLNGLMEDILRIITEHDNLEPEPFSKAVHEQIHAQMACKAAVKAGDQLRIEQIDQLLTDLAKSENRFSCPHGRPVLWTLSQYEIEKKFKRKL